MDLPAAHRPGAITCIVVSRCGGEKEWVEVLDAGCFDLVCAPFSARQVLYVVEHAVADYEAQALKSVA